uniref:NADH-ubiquinone oxidoreductase chain 5 n=1 Tax=Paphia euglypta TaxID=345428 RepID=E2DYW5_9BIVA|nr:NADH dehydrogenase subunit 5 [Paphia euglypta]ADB03054.1 NADH dehydrogenase subunit 5 [Paphia euglypta]
MNGVITCFLLCFAFLCTMKVMNLAGGVTLVLEWEMSEKFLSEMSFLLVVDWVSCSFVSSVLFISGCVGLFSNFYMAHDSFIERFTHLIQVFVLSMVILILFPGFWSMMVGWDGLGVVSFLLVVYYINSESLSAGMITAISNRIGDVCFIMVISVLNCFLSFSYMSGNVFIVSFLGVLIMLGSMTKSAQVPFSAWLPEAMAAPTPVSTLVHSSTLVTAGVYVLIRFMEYLGEFEKSVLMVVSFITIIMAGSSGSLEVDMKKVVALSTLSQVGMMMFTLSMGSNEVAYFHLLVHAFFKALMFMCVGGVIFYSGGYQDARFLGGIWFKLPLTSCLLIFSNLSLMGLPFLSGFYSKELIMGTYLVGNCSWISSILLLFSLGFTMCYAVRMMMLMLMDMGSCSWIHFKMENGFYIASLVLMSNGAAAMAVFMQLYLSSFENKILFMQGSIFYSFMGNLSVVLLNVIVLLILFKFSPVSKILKSIFSSMWFLKPMSGNIISKFFLINVSKFVNSVEMSVIRGYLFQDGLKLMVLGLSNKFRKMNFSLIGLALFYCVCFMVLVYY